MDSKSLKLDGNGALFEQLARALKLAILDGRFVAGGRLPATRTLAQTLGLSRNTVIGAYELLCAEQLAFGHAGSCTRIAKGPRPPQTGRPRKTRPPSRYAARARTLSPIAIPPLRASLRYDLQYGVPVMSAPAILAWRRKLAAAALRADPGYAPSCGLKSLRDAVCEYLARRRGVVCTPESILIVSGTQQALTLTARVILDEGGTAVLEDPHYQFALHALLAHGARIVQTRTDHDGLVVSELPARGVRLVCVTPSHQFPSGVVMSFARRVELLEYAVKHDAWILEDDYDSEFRYADRPLPALRSLDLADRVIYVGSFSKTLFPTLRLGYVACPAPLRDDFFMAKRLDDLGCPAIEQAALAAFMQSRQFEKYLRKSTAELEDRHAALVEGLRRHAGSHLELTNSQAGMHLVAWLRGADYVQLERLIKLGATLGLGLHPIHPFYRKKPARPGLVLGFAGISVARIREATELLGKCLREILD